MDRMEAFREIIGKRLFSRQDYLRQNKELSSATASSDLKEAVAHEVLKKTGDKRLTKYQFIW